MIVWSVGWKTPKGGWRNVMTVHAETEDEARAEAERQLKRPGRLDYWKKWQESGKSVKPHEELEVSE